MIRDGEKKPTINAQCKDRTEKDRKIPNQEKVGQELWKAATEREINQLTKYEHHSSEHS